MLLTSKIVDTKSVLEGIIKEVGIDIEAENGINSFDIQRQKRIREEAEATALSTLLKNKLKNNVPANLKNSISVLTKQCSDDNNFSSLASVSNFVCHSNHNNNAGTKEILPILHRCAVTNQRNLQQIKQKQKLASSVGGNGVANREVTKRIVITAAKLVAFEIRSGDWDFAPTTSKTNAIDRDMIASAIEEFAVQVMLPSLLKSSVGSFEKHRIFIASLSILWEVLMQNDAKIFGKEFDMEDDSGDISSEDAMTEEYSSDDDTVDDCSNCESDYRLSDVCAAVIFAAIENSTTNSATAKQLKNGFERVISSYVNGNQKFILRLEPSTCTSSSSDRADGSITSTKTWKIRSYRK